METLSVVVGPLAAIIAVAAMIKIARLKAQQKELEEKKHSLQMGFLHVLQELIATASPEDIENMAGDVNEVLNDIQNQIDEIQVILNGT